MDEARERGRQSALLLRSRGPAPDSNVTFRMAGANGSFTADVIVKVGDRLLHSHFSEVFVRRHCDQVVLMGARCKCTMEKCVCL